MKFKKRFSGNIDYHDEYIFKFDIVVEVVCPKHKSLIWTMLFRFLNFDLCILHSLFAVLILLQS